jgi:hypothetical protein
MPLSESERLEINPVFDAVFVQISENINNTFPDDHNRHFFKSLLTGGKIMANEAVARCQGLREVCGVIDMAKALALTKLFTLLMLSQTFRWLENQESGTEEEVKVNLSAVSVVLNLFNDSSEESVKDFINMDTQFRYEMNHHDHMTHLAVLLLARACEICGHKCIEWSKVNFPFKSLQPLTTSRTIVDAAMINSVNDNRAVISSLASGVQAMVNYHEEHSKS